MGAPGTKWTITAERALAAVCDRVCDVDVCECVNVNEPLYVSHTAVRSSLSIRVRPTHAHLRRGDSQFRGDARHDWGKSGDHARATRHHSVWR
jgi:hypothetical protein